MMDTIVPLWRKATPIDNAVVIYREMRNWLRENNVKWSIHTESWGSVPDELFMSSADALAFKLRFGL